MFSRLFTFCILPGILFIVLPRVNGAAYNTSAITDEVLTYNQDTTITIDNKYWAADSITMDNSGLTINGNGRADLNVVSISNSKTFVIGSNDISQTIVAIDGGKMADKNANLGTVSFGNLYSRLEIYGNTSKKNTVIGSTDDPDQILNMSSLTNWVWDANSRSIRSSGARTQAFVNDNYLAASQIHQKYTGLNAVRDHMISGATKSVPLYDYYGQNSDIAEYTTVLGSEHYKPRGAWVNYIGRDSHYRSSFNRNDWDFGTDGVQVGTDIFRTGRDQFGVFFGYEGTTGNNLADRLEANDHYIGLYGVRVFNNGADLRVIFNFGWQDFDSVRFDRRYGFYKSSFDGNTAELNVEFGKRRYFGNWSARPVFAIDWYRTQLGSGWEAGSDLREAMRYDSTDLSQLFFRFGSDLRYEWRRWAIEGGLYYSYDMRGADLWTGVSDVATGELYSALVGSKLGRSVLTFNLSGSLSLYRNFSVFGGYRAEVTPERAGDGYVHTGFVGGAWRW